MSGPAEAVIERERVREVAGVFHSRQALNDAAQALLLAGFDRADIDVMAGLDAALFTWPPRNSRISRRCRGGLSSRRRTSSRPRQ